MSVDLFMCLERAYDVLKAADLVARRTGFGIQRNERAQRLIDSPPSENHDARAQYASIAQQGQEPERRLWCAYVGSLEAWHDDPIEAVRLVEKQCAREATRYLHDKAHEMDRIAATARAALVTIDAIMAKESKR